MSRRQRPSSPPQTEEELQLTRGVIAKWRRLTPESRAFLAQFSGREPLASNLRTARENRGLSQDAVAKKVGLSRTLVAQIELGNRPVTGDELAKFADLYGTTVVELTGTRVYMDNPVTATLLNLAPELLKEFDIQGRIGAVLSALTERDHLERLLERPARTEAPLYSLRSPRTLADALRQGEETAEQERQRLGLRHAPVPELANLFADQGVPVFALKLPDTISGLFIAHPPVGRAVVVNVGHDAVRQRLAIAHGYAHALCEPMGTIRVCTQTNTKELIERRAAAFAAAFLLPAAGVIETVRRLGKGQSSRQEYWGFDAATEHSVRAEERSTPGSQTMTFVDGVWITRRFGTTYKLAIARLLGLALVNESDQRRLLRPTAVTLAQECLAVLDRTSAPPPTSPVPTNRVVPLSDLQTDQFYMLIEAYRRDLITKADFLLDASVLADELPGLSQAKLLEVAEAAR